MPRTAGPAWKNAVWLGAPLLLAAALRLHGYDWSRPDFFEEATPLKEAWGLWAWGPDSAFDGNPHFFRYPSLVIYLHFLLQGALFGVLRLAGTVRDALDFQMLYTMDGTPFFLAGRLLAVAFGVATVWVTTRLGARVGGPAMGAVAGTLLALSAFHVDLSQWIAVDGPLTFFATWALLRCVCFHAVMTRRNALLAGLAIGLATSSKYTGAFLVVPFVVAWLLGRGPDLRQSAAALVVGLAAAAVAFALTSPYVLLDLESAWRDIGSEREHMAVGHFGLERGAAWGDYLHALWSRMLGWPGILAAAGGLALAAAARRETWAIIVASFAVVYAGVVGSWSMSADHYLLPLLPPLLLFAAVVPVEIARRLEGRLPPGGPAAAIVVTAIAVALPSALRLPEAYAKARPDTRRQAREFIERTFPPESFVLTEHHGANLRSSADLFQLPDPLRERVLDDPDGRTVYTLIHLLMSQAYPEDSAPFYDLQLYADADVFVLTGDVGDRYAAEPERFARQLAFYREVERVCDKIAEFVPAGGPGSRITVWRPRRPGPTFGERGTVQGPKPLADPEGARSGPAADFYFWLGFAYESHGFFPEAVEGYRLGLLAKNVRRGSHARLVIAIARCLLVAGERERAEHVLRQSLEVSPWAADRARIEQVLNQLPALLPTGD